MGNERKLRLGTRGSKLALAQAESVQGQLAKQGVEMDIFPIRTSGDRGDRSRLGAFVREIQESILEGAVDVALHCLKDLPTTAVPGLQLSAYLPREAPWDTLISKFSTIEDLPEGAVVGTGSLRRTSQLAAIRSDLCFRPLVGNVDTRLRKLVTGEYDAIVLAIAGLSRLGLLEGWAASDFSALTVTPLRDDVMVPAPGQAILVLETRIEDEFAIEAVHPLADASSESCARAERSFLARFGGGCSVPVAAWATSRGEGEIRLVGLVASPDGQRVHRAECWGLASEAERVGLALANQLGELGAFEIVAEVLKSREVMA